ncbi:MAG: hypothetical protein AAGI52_10930 [Bacteroidota bacterium]
MTDWRRHLLWIDSLGGLAVGALVLLAGAWLVTWYEIPGALLFGMGAANVLYGTYSYFLAKRAVRPMAMIAFLVVANLTWAALCLFWTVHYWGEAHPVALLHIGGEGLYVGALAVLEWRNRYLLLTTG